MQLIPSLDSTIHHKESSVRTFIAIALACLLGLSSLPASANPAPRHRTSQRVQHHRHHAHAKKHVKHATRAMHKPHAKPAKRAAVKTK